jgi:hemolysin D
VSELASRQSLEAGQARAAGNPRPRTEQARLVADAAARITFENIDKENFLLIVAPVDGVITDVTST